MKEKKWYESSTIWLNIVGVIIIALQMVLQSNTLNPDVAALILAVLNILNRIRSEKPAAPIERSVV